MRSCACETHGVADDNLHEDAEQTARASAQDPCCVYTQPLPFLRTAPALRPDHPYATAAGPAAAALRASSSVPTPSAAASAGTSRASTAPTSPVWPINTTAVFR